MPTHATAKGMAVERTLLTSADQLDLKAQLPSSFGLAMIARQYWQSAQLCLCKAGPVGKRQAIGAGRWAQLTDKNSMGKLEIADL